MFRVMVVEDDSSTRLLMKAMLERNGYEVLQAEDGQVALDLLEKEHVDLMLLDVMMPQMDGLQLTRTLREHGNDIPIIMVTAKEAVPDRREGFRAGTDDYLVKPVDEEEMLLRISALLRRAGIASSQRIEMDHTLLDYSAHTITNNGVEEQIPLKEFQLLFKLLSTPNKVFTRRQLMDEIWDMDSETDERTVDVHINRLRDRFRDSADFEIVTVRGLGYKAVKRD